ncbi:MAG: 23S rRNA (adenine(2503)-C(2))-methyltransferase RlmN [Rhodothermales bacterium]|nr:23S rRNA (adenine(2503)-C(2))-methyltransferase RlmN [Rhodothermales bacterium]
MSAAASDAARTDLKALDRAELEAYARSLEQPAFRGRQLFGWLYGRGARTFDEMTDLPKALRERLAAEATIPQLDEVQRQTATDGTVKCLFRLPSGREVESVLIPDVDDAGKAKRLTVCVSSQVGCAMGCHFCATGLMGFHENLTAGAIFDQVRHMSAIAEERYGRPATNVVYMGMGEPLQNYAAAVKSAALLADPDGLGLSPKRVTVSTVGLARRIRQLADDQAEGRVVPFRLAVSLHAPTDAQRSAIMPVNRSEKTDLSALKDALQHYGQRTGQRVTYEYCMFAGVNDTEADARHLAAVTRWTPSKVNLIMYNPVGGAGFSATDEAQLDRFIRALVREGVRVTVRRSRGQDIDAACGQLAGQHDGSAA